MSFFGGKNRQERSDVIDPAKLEEDEFTYSTGVRIKRLWGIKDNFKIFDFLGRERMLRKRIQ